MTVPPPTSLFAFHPSAGAARTGWRIAIGVFAALTGALARHWLTAPGDVLYLVFLPLVEIAAFAGGIVSAVTGVCVSVLLASFMFRAPHGLGDFVDMLVFAGAAVGLPMLAQLMRTELARTPQQAIAVPQKVAWLQAIIEDARDGAFTLDPDNRVLSANKAALAMFGRAPGEIACIDFMTLFSDMSQLQESDGPTRNSVFIAEGRRWDGATFPAEVAMKSFPLDDASLRVAFVSDLSERASSRQRIEKLTFERLSAISGIMSSLAHEINQPLTAAAAYLNAGKRLIARQPELAGGPVAETVEKAAAQIIRAAQTIRSLRELVAWGEPDKTLVSVNEMIEETLEHIGPLAREANITIQKDFGLRDDLVVADRAQIKQVLVNIARNAIEAMHGASCREMIISTSMFEPGSIRVEIRDTGPGFSEVEGAALFEPFVTTKKGMGIGLSMCRVIVEAHYGQLWARQNPERGATFGFDLPLREKEPNA